MNEHCLVTGNPDWLTERQSIFTTLERDREGGPLRGLDLKGDDRIGLAGGCLVTDRGKVFS